MNTMTRDRKVAHIGQLMVAVALTATLAACGGGGGGDSAPPPAPTPIPNPPPPPAPSPSAGDLSSTVQPTTYTVGSSQANAYATLNAARLQGGFGTVAQNAALDSEAQSQADFIAANYTVPSAVGGVEFNATALAALQPDGNETGHVQLSTLPDQTHFTGYLPSDRAAHFGYPSADVAESAGFGNWSAEAGATCVSELLLSPSHRQLLLDPRFRDFGVGVDALPFNTAGTISATDCYIATAAQSFTYSTTGQATAPTGWVGIYPADGTTVFATDDIHGHGFAPSVTVDSQLTLTVTSFIITDSTGTVVPTTLNADAITTSTFANWAVATPNAVLNPSTTYTVNFQGSAGGTAIAKAWTFTTPAN